MIHDLRDTLRYWRVVHLLGFSTLRSRYARSRFGQAWISLSNAIFIFVVGFIWAKIWKMPLGEYLPYVGLGYVIFLLLSHSLSESCAVLVLDARVYSNESRPFLLSVFALVYKNLIIFVHNIPLIIALVIWAGPVRGVGLAYPLFWFLTILFLVSAGYALALVCARFRDMTQIVALIMQTAFLLTPVVWQMDFVPADFRDLVIMANPFAAFIELLRGPLIGQGVSALVLMSSLGWTLGSLALAWLAHSLFRREIIFWI
jgi:lipopolysaccharide transport system permease protein